jgi:catechol 2,3-dioxygenase-like lactoylglutathione lyase family enzyme
MPATPQIKQMATVFVPVSEQDRALEFYVDKLGFEKRTDFTYADGRRWVEVVPPGAETSIALIPPQDGGSVGIETRIALTSEDVDAAHARLAALGVDVDAAVMREGDPVVHWGGVVLAGIPPMFLCRDPDGNSLLMG